MGGTLTLVAAGILCCLKLWGRRLSLGALALAGGLAVGVFAVGGILDYLRPQEDQTHLGRFVGSVLDGSATIIVIRKADAAIGTIGRPLTWVGLAAVIAAIYIWRKRAPIRSDAVGAAVIGLTAVAVIGALVNDSGTAVPGFTVALGFGLLAVAVGPRPPETADAATPVERAETTRTGPPHPRSGEPGPGGGYREAHARGHVEHQLAQSTPGEAPGLARQQPAGRGLPPRTQVRRRRRASRSAHLRGV
jgi:hypothetical protein